MLPTLPKTGLAPGAAADDILDVEVVVGVGGLEPGAAVVQVEMDGVGRREGVVHAVEDILLVALVVEDGELRRIEKSAGVETVSLDEITPVLVAIGEIEAATCRAEGAIGGEDAPVGLVTPWPERVVATMTRLVLPPYSAGGAPEMTSMD